MQNVARIVQSSANNNFTVSQLKEKLHKDHLFLLELLAITEGNSFNSIQKRMLKDLNADKDFWLKASNSSELNKKFLTITIQKYKQFFDEEFLYPELIHHLK